MAENWSENNVKNIRLIYNLQCNENKSKSEHKCNHSSEKKEKRITINRKINKSEHKENSELKNDKVHTSIQKKNALYLIPLKG